MPASYGLPRGKPWLKITIEAGDSDDALTTSLRPSLAALRDLVDPQFGLAMLSSAVTVKAVGKDHLDIVDTTKYLATIDVARNADENGAAGEAARELLHQGVKTLKAYLWVTSAGLPHQLSVVTPLPRGEATRVFTYQQWERLSRSKRRRWHRSPHRGWRASERQITDAAPPTLRCRRATTYPHGCHRPPVVASPEVIEGPARAGGPRRCYGSLVDLRLF